MSPHGSTCHNVEMMETLIAADWTRAGKAVDARIIARGAKIRAVARQAGIDPSTLWKLRRGHGQLLSPQLRTRIDGALGWPAGTIDRIANDPNYLPPADPDPADPDRLEVIERQLAEALERLDRLSRLLGE
jgi:transposase-like protein